MDWIISNDPSGIEPRQVAKVLVTHISKIESFRASHAASDDVDALLAKLVKALLSYDEKRKRKAHEAGAMAAEQPSVETTKRPRV